MSYWTERYQSDEDYRNRMVSTAKRRYASKKEQICAASVRRNKKQRAECLARYSNETMQCACCAEVYEPFLTIDHIDRGGKDHRKKIGFGGARLYQWLRHNGFPEGYRVLCLNCNARAGRLPQNECDCPKSRKGEFGS